MTLLVPAVLAALAVAIGVGLPGPRRALIVPAPARRLRSPAPLLVPVATFGVALVPLGPVGAGVAGVLVHRVRRALEQRRRRAARRLERQSAGEAMAVLAGELRTGRPPGMALVGAADVASGATGVALAEAARSSSLGAGAAEALQRHAECSAVPELLSGLAVCWEVCQGAGSSLAVAVDTLEDALREDQACRDEVDAELEGARSTAILLAVLPVLGLALGAGLGGNPLHMLLRTPAGWACLCLGVGLELLGLWWTERIVRAAGGEP